MGGGRVEGGEGVGGDGGRKKMQRKEGEEEVGGGTGRTAL